MGIPRVGSLGPAGDMWAVAHAACYAGYIGGERTDVRGHRWTPPESIAKEFDWYAWTEDEGSPGRTQWQEDRSVPFHPKCPNCGKSAKRVMERRGVQRETIKARFAALGAKWSWTSRESDEARRNSDKGVMVVSESGVLTTDSGVRTKRRRVARRIEQDDQKQANRERAAKREQIAKQRRAARRASGE